MSDNPTRLNVPKKYTDFQELMRDIPVSYPNARSGIVILFDDDENMLALPVCKQSQMALAGADLIVKSATIFS